MRLGNNESLRGSQVEHVAGLQWITTGVTSRACGLATMDHYGGHKKGMWLGYNGSLRGSQVGHVAGLQWITTGSQVEHVAGLQWITTGVTSRACGLATMDHYGGHK